jgi:uncharacterized protein
MTHANLPAGNAAIRVQFVFARPGDIFLTELELPEGASIGDAIDASGLYQRLPGFDLALHRTGVYGKVLPLDHRLASGDRVEIYRPLPADREGD